MIIYHGNISSDRHISVSEYVGGGKRPKLRGGVELPPDHYHDVYHVHHDDEDDQDCDYGAELIPDNQDHDNGDDPDPD